MSVPRSLNFDIASHVLRKIWSKIVQVGGNYETSYQEALGFSTRPNNEVSLRTLVGLKAPSSPTGVTARFVNRFFPGMNEQQRQTYFTEGAPAGFDRFMEEMRNNSEFRLQITKGANLLLLELTARRNRDDNPDLYHLSIFPNPTALPNVRLHYNVHVTQEPSGTGERVYYRFNDVFGEILQHDNKPVPKYVPPHMRKGGLRTRRPLYTNAQTSDIPRSNAIKHSRLRKRTRTRRTHRI